MNMKEFTANDQPDWLDHIADNLNRFPIHLSSNQWLKGTNFHRQPGLEIHITLEGEGTMVAGRQILLQKPRSVLMFRGSVPHQMISRSSYKRTVICLNLDNEGNGNLPKIHDLIDFSWVPRKSCLNFSLSPKQFQQIEEMCELLRCEFELRNDGWERMVLAYVLKISVILQRNATATNKVISLSDRESDKKNDIVQKCADYVCQNLEEDLTLRAVARRFAVSEEHLTRSFTKEMGVSYYQFVLLQRVAEAKRLLYGMPDVSITEIAHMIGFPSSSHFNRNFKILMEETPSSYRKRMLDKKRR